MTRRAPCRDPIGISRHAMAALLALVVPACGEAPTPGQRAAATDSAAAAPSRVLTGNRVAGILLDPTVAKRGHRMGTLTLDSIEVRAAHDSTHVGTARFTGQLELSGTRMRHFEADARDPCFEADSASAARMPRWRGDERRAWFCFENPAEATRALSAVSDGARFVIVVDRFTIHRGHSDEVNSARLVRVVD